MDAALRPAPTPWILNPGKDLALFVAPPLLIVPLIALVQLQFSAAQIGLYVAAFGATGHHLPGLLRAYGDRELFHRFRVRFIAAPILLTACCVGLANTNLRALGVIVLMWGTWHGLAQVFGILRIYDAKAGSNEKLTVRLDRWLLVAWFGAGLLYSPGRMASLLGTFYSGGVPLLPENAISNFTSIWTMATGALSIAFVVNLISCARRGSPASRLKLPTLASSIGFWWYSMVWIDNAILGIALFEIFHDVQYFAITWVFSRNRIAKGHAMGAFSRFLFRPSGLMIALYISIGLLYGYAIHLPGLIEADWLSQSLLGLVATSALLHFYYDGFIWKVRERSTREGLGLSGGRQVETPWLHRGIGHVLLWGLFALPLGILILSELRGVETTISQRRNIAAAVPSAYAFANLGIALRDDGQFDAAIAAFRQAVELEPGSIPARVKLARSLQRAGQFDEAIRQHRTALDHSGGSFRRHDALGSALLEAGRFEEAIAEFELALAREPSAPGVRDRLADALTRGNRAAEAISHLEQIASDRPDSWEAAYNLGTALSSLGRADEALTYLDRARSIAPEQWQIHQGLARAYRQLGRSSEATQQQRIAAALRKRPKPSDGAAIR